MPAIAKPSFAKNLTPGSLTPRQKAALLIMSMGAEAAGQVLRQLGPREIEEITTQITELSEAPEPVRKQVLNEFAQQLERGEMAVMEGTYVARTLLNSALGEEQARAVMDRVAPMEGESQFAFLESATPIQIASVLQREHPQTIALVLAHVPSKRAAELLKALPPEVQGPVVERVGTMDRITPELLRRVADLLKKQLSSANSTQRQIGGAKTLADILVHTGADDEKRLLAELAAQNQNLAEEIRKLMLTFDDLGGLGDAGMQALLREVDISQLALALKGAADNLKALVYKNLSSRAAERLKEEMELLGPKPKSEVKTAQQAIVTCARKLEEDGKLTLSRGGADDELVE